MSVHGLVELSREAGGRGREASDAIYYGHLSTEAFLKVGNRWLVPESEWARVVQTLKALKGRRRQPAKELATTAS